MQSDLSKIASGRLMAFTGAFLGNGASYVYGLIIGRLLGAEVLGL
jgi:hypothetical protein